MEKTTRKKDPLVADLRRLMGPEKVLADFSALTSYAIDAGIYKIPPRAVVLIQEERDIPRVLEYAKRNGIGVTARSGGTNLTGNAIGEGIILEFSGYRKILEINREGRWMRAQPGVTYADLNRALEPFSLRFAPDPSSGEMCKLGGMLGNNAAGPHTLKYGATKDNVLSLEVYLADGARITARPYRLDEPQYADLIGRCPQFSELASLVKDHRDLIRERKPKVTKNSSGYNLFALADGLAEGSLDLPRLFVGSEGTLGLTTEAKLRLIESPPRTATALIYFTQLGQVGEAVQRLLDLSPSAMEVMDSNTMDIVGRARFGIPDGAAALLLVEFDEEPLEERLSGMNRICGEYDLCDAVRIAQDAGEQVRFWEARKAIYPALYRFDRKRHPVNFADDVVVPARRLSELIAFLEAYFRDLRVPVAVYGHIGNGNAHINPLLNLEDPADTDRMRKAYKDIHEKVIREYEGSICGEHGDGRIRKSMVRDQFGEELYRLFQATKRIMDPEGILNPGVKIDPEVPTPEAGDFTRHLDSERLAKACATCAKCNTVCPAYDIAAEESNGARGWFHILTARDYSYEKAGRVVEACLNCKSCRTVCPAGIDVSEEAIRRRAERPNRLMGGIFWLQDRRPVFEGLLRGLGRTQWLWDRPVPRRILDLLSRPVLRMLAPTARLPHDMIIPRIASRQLRQRHAALVNDGGSSSEDTIAYFHGCAANYFMDGVGDSVISILQKLGHRVALPEQKCSGTPIQTYGHLQRVEAYARFNLQSLLRFKTVVTGCASCTFMLKDYPNLLAGTGERERAAELASRVVHITELFEREGIAAMDVPQTRSTRERVVTYHSSCHLRAAGVSQAPRRALSALPGLKFVEMPDADRCAGGSGTFIVKNYDLSREIFRRKEKAVEKSGAQIVATSCPACIIQLKNGLREGTEVRHVAELADEALPPKPAYH